MLERNEMQMLASATIYNVALHLYPGVGLETIFLFPRSNAQIGIHVPAPEHTAENERLFETAGAEE
jgi:hypothetical protein